MRGGPRVSRGKCCIMGFNNCPNVGVGESKYWTNCDLPVKFKVKSNLNGELMKKSFPTRSLEKIESFKTLSSI